MPIHKENRARYPSDWPQISQLVKERARYRCEECGVPHLAWGWRDGRGRFNEVNPAPLIEAGYKRPPFTLRTSDGFERKVIVIVLTVAHLDHTPENSDPRNLRAWCQACHLAYDAKHHQAARFERAHRAANTLDLFA